MWKIWGQRGSALERQTDAGKGLGKRATSRSSRNCQGCDMVSVLEAFVGWKDTSAGAREKKRRRMYRKELEVHEVSGKDLRRDTLRCPSFA